MSYKDPEAKRRYEEAHREEARERARKWYLEHREERLAARRRAYAGDPERTLAEQRRYRKEHPDREQATNRRKYVKNRQKILARERVRYDKSGREGRLLREYGLTLAQWNGRLAAQGGLCMICRKRPATDVDHDHSTGVVRDLLCSRCNRLLGAAEDSIAILQAAMDYLIRHAPIGGGNRQMTFLGEEAS